MTKMHSLYIYNFIKNIKWKNVEGKYVIGVFANDATVAQIRTVLASRTFNGKAIEIKKTSSPAQASDCHIIFVSTEFSSNISKLSANSQLKNKLLVSESGGIESGASIGFFVEGSKLKFKINEPVCKSSDLQISATLLSLGV